MKYPIRIRKKGKTVGRPSKLEKYMSETMSYYVQHPKMKEAFAETYLNSELYGMTDYSLIEKAMEEILAEK